MNDRLRELLLKVVPMQGEDGEYLPSLVTEEHIEKFSNLIVNECVNRLRFEGELGKVQTIAGPSGIYKIAFMNEAANIIKEHFGLL